MLRPNCTGKILNTPLIPIVLFYRAARAQRTNIITHQLSVYARTCVNCISQSRCVDLITNYCNALFMTCSLDLKRAPKNRAYIRFRITRLHSRFGQSVIFSCIYSIARFEVAKYARVYSYTSSRDRL